jgi:hypothetical protein
MPDRIVLTSLESKHIKFTKAGKTDPNREENYMGLKLII